MKRILYLSDQGMTAFLVEGRRLVGKRHYALGEAGLGEFTEDLRQAPEIITRLVLDITEEEFHEEKVPHVFSHDQKRILERRLRQRFRNVQWSYRERQGREKQGRRDDIFLLSGITREELLRPWLDRLLEQCVPLDTVTSVPLLVPHLYRMMRLKHEYALFVSHGEAGGIRQVFLANGRLKVSRLAPTPHYEERQYADHIVDEVKRMKLFLNNTHLLPFDRTLHLYVLGSNEVNSLLGREVADEDGLRLHNYNLQALVERFHFKGWRGQGHADTFFSLLAATRKGIPSYARGEEKRCYYHHRARKLLATAAVALMISSVAVTAQGLFWLAEQQENLLQLEKEIGVYQVKLEQLRRSRPEGEVSGFLMRDAVEFQQRLQRLAVSPFDYFPSVGQSLLRHPTIRLRQLNYRLLPDAGELGSAGVAEQSAAALSTPEEMVTRGSETGRQPLPVVQLDGEIEAGGRSYRQIHRDFTRWLQGLREAGDFSWLRVDRWPLEIRPDRSLVMEGAPVEGSRPIRFSLILAGEKLL